MKPTGYQERGALSAEVIEATARVIGTYGLWSQGETVLVALSGGKDSLVLALVLRELGVDQRPVVIDMGYEDGWAGRVTGAASTVGLSTTVLDVRALGGTRPTPGGGDFLSRNLQALGADSSSGSFTPCTYCYNAKVLALESFADEAGATKVAFGHHRTDACASLLKEGLMHIDRWDRGNDRYARARFAEMVAELVTECRSTSAESGMLDRVEELVKEGVVDTDEPPRQPLREGSLVQIVRPLFDVTEDQIVKERVRLDLPTEPSGCGHGATVDTETSREMVHRAVLREACNEELDARLRSLLLTSIRPDGTGRARARWQRSTLLGLDYKPVVDGLQKL